MRAPCVDMSAISGASLSTAAAVSQRVMPNARPIRIEGDIAYVPLTHGKVAVIDAADAPLVAGRNWQATPKRRPYAMRHGIVDGRKRTIWMHRVFIDVPPGLFVDHIDGDELNNRRSNLRICTVRQNAMNRRTYSNNTTGRKGVSVFGNRFRAAIRVEGRTISLGLHTTVAEAAMAYEAAASRYYGPFARPNRGAPLRAGRTKT